MKKFYEIGLAMLLICYCTVGAMAQLVCVDSVTVELHEFSGTAELLVGSIVASGISEGAKIDRSSFNCEDLGTTIKVTANDGVTSCWSLVSVIDRTAPVAIVDIDVEIIIPQGVTELVINPVILDDGSYDNCGALTLSADPARITCADVGKEIQVVLSVTDESGNVNSAMSIVHVTGSTAVTLNCIQDFEISIVENFTITPQFILNGTGTCSEITFSITDSNGNEIEGGTINNSHVGQTVQATVTQLEDNSTCSTNISVVELPCDPFFVCDTECNSAPVGDCDSGHTYDDFVEWPCDLTINADYPGFDGSTSELLIANYGVSDINARPQIVEDECFDVAVAYDDQIFYSGNMVKIVREWGIIEWKTLYMASYSQIIVFESGGSDLVWNICDTESNDTEIGDCASGHTNLDDVEWPADVSAVDHRITPNELTKVTKVLHKDSRPVFVDNEEYYRVSYVDAVLSSTANFSLVGRVWTIQSTQSAAIEAEYLQNITIPVIENAEDKVFVTTHGGRPMPGVQVNGSQMTDNQGVTLLQEADVESLVYEDDPIAGLDVMDEVLGNLYILGVLNWDQSILDIMDINGNEGFTTLDLVLLRKLYLGINDPSEYRSGWKFRRRTDPLTNVKGDYVSYKVGDLDDSAMLSELLPEITTEQLIIEDQLLNAGEEYEVEIKSNIDLDIYAGQFSYEIDLDKIEIVDVVSDYYGDELTWALTNEGTLKITVRDESIYELKKEIALMRVSLKAKANSTLAESVALHSLKPSFFVSSEVEKVYLSGGVSNEITSGINGSYVSNVELVVTPNPASDFVEIQIESEREVSIMVYNAQGTKVASSSRSRIDVAEYPPGIYFLKGTNGNINFSSKFVKL